MTEGQNETLERNSKSIGMTKSAYLRQAVEVFNWIVENRKEMTVTVRNDKNNDFHRLFIPGVTDV
jgi:hypothetical protein